MERVTLIVHDITGCTYDIEVPLDISPRELIKGLHIGLNHAGMAPLAIRAENPIAYLTGDSSLSEYGLRDGSNLYFYEGDEQK